MQWVEERIGLGISFSVAFDHHPKRESITWKGDVPFILKTTNGPPFFGHRFHSTLRLTHASRVGMARKLCPAAGSRRACVDRRYRSLGWINANRSGNSLCARTHFHFLTIDQVGHLLFFAVLVCRSRNLCGLFLAVALRVLVSVL